MIDLSSINSLFTYINMKTIMKKVKFLVRISDINLKRNGQSYN